MKYIDFGEQIKSVRKAAGVTQQALADKLGVHLQTVSKWERGVSQPDVSMLGDIAKICNVTLEKLLDVPTVKDEVYQGVFDVAKLCAKITELRRTKGESQSELAEVCEFSADSVSRWERGVSCPDASELCAIAEHFGVNVSEVYFGVVESTDLAAAGVIDVANGGKRRKVSKVTYALAVLSLVCLVSLCVIVAATVAERTTMYVLTVNGVDYTVNYGDVFEPQEEHKSGYLLLGWVDSAGNSATFPVTVRNSCTYTAVYKPYDYNVEYWLNGGQLEQTPRYTYNVENLVGSLPTPVKDGAEFQGWYLTADYSGEPLTELYCTYSDVKLYARWSDGTYGIKYVLGGGQMTERNPEVVGTDVVTLANPVRVGYTFVGWFDSPDGGKRYTEVGGELVCNLTLYAVWQKNEAVYDVIYNLDGGENNDENPSTIQPGDLVSLKSPSKRGHDFVGWYDNPSFTGEPVKYLYNLTADVTLYALFQPRTYLFVYVLSGGKYADGGTNPNEIVYGQTVTLRPLVKYGFDFVGWYTQPDGGNKVEQITSDNIAELAADESSGGASGATTLYALFEMKKFTVSFDADGGAFDDGSGATVSQKTYTIGFYDDFTMPEPVKTDFVFVGWADESGKVVQQIDFRNIANMSLVAVWREYREKYNVTYVLDGGTLSEANPSQIAPDETITFAEPTKTGYEFLGWFDAEGRQYVKSPKGNFDDLTLYAKWQQYGPTITEGIWTYRKENNGITLANAADTSDAADIIVPDEIDGLPVKKLGEKLFAQKKLNSLVLPDSLEEIGEHTFAYCDIVAPLEIPRGVASIGNKAFEMFGGSLTFADGCKLTEIGDWAFYCAKISNVVVLPDCVKTLGNGAFASASLRGLVLNEGLTTVGKDAVGLYGDVTVYLPSTVKVCLADSSRVVVSAKNTFLVGGWKKATHGTVTLHDGEQTKVVDGECIALPTPEKVGFRFLGWATKPTGGKFVQQVYLPSAVNPDVDLYAVYAQLTDSDGITAVTPLALKCDQSVTVTLQGMDKLYFYFDVGTSTEVMLVVTVVGDSEYTPDCKIYTLEGKSCGVARSKFVYYPTDVLYIDTMDVDGLPRLYPFEVTLMLIEI